MYMLGLYTICVDLTLLLGAILFAGFTGLLIITDGCHMLAAMVAAALARVRLSIFETPPTRLVHRFAFSDRGDWTRKFAGHPVLPRHRVLRMR
jgi:hypothetical protein